MSQQAKQQVLFEADQSFRILVDGLVDYALYMLGPTGVIASWNSGGQRILGYAPNEIIGQHFSRFLPETERADGKPARALQTAREQGRYEEEGWRVRKDGTFFWANVVIDPIHEGGRLVGFAKITRDISDRREAQINLEKMQKQLSESQKLEALGQLTGGVAHDFNNLLMIISGSVELLKRGVGTDPRMLRAVAAIESATKRGAGLTGQLLSFSRRQSVYPEPVNLAKRIDAIRQVLVTGAGRAVQLAYDIDPLVWPVTVDVVELETALVNLVINARDALPSGGTITISAHNRPMPGAGDYVEICVEDTGLGVAPEILSKIFDPFFTTKPVGKGTGLGLSQVHGFVHQAGGTVSVQSELGKGTRVAILLPRKRAVEGSDGDDTAEVGAKGTVLLVEDNPEVATVSRNLLEQLGYDVLRATDAAAALRELQSNNIDLVFSDIVMPGDLDGLGLAHHLRQARPDLPVLLATGYSGAAADVRGDFPILRKPYDIHQLKKAIAGLRRY